MKARIKTKLTELLQIEYPIIQGGMGWIGVELAAAVSNAGGLGVITAGNHAQAGGLDGLREQIRKCKSLTDKPFAVNFLLLNNTNDWHDIVELVIREGLKCVETSGRSPRDMIDRFKKAGVVIIHKCTTIRHALSVEKAGVDIIEIAGLDLGGHPGEKDVGNWVLLAKAGQMLSVPWIAAGGTAIGTQLAAALTLGASGVNMGTRFMATQECEVHPNIKEALVRGTEEDTELLMRGYNTLRVFKNAAAKRVKQLEEARPQDRAAIREWMRPDGHRVSFESSGDPDSEVWSIGQSMGLFEDIPSVSTLMRRMVEEAAEALAKTNACLVRSNL